MPNSYIPNKDADLVAWLANFLTVANANLAPLGLIAGDLTPISTLQPTYSTNLNDVEAKKAALASAVDTKDATKDSIVQKVRIVVNKIQANPAANIMQRFLTSRFLKAGFSVSVSARALIILLPIKGSLAQKGIKPHLNRVNSFFPSLIIAAIFCEGAILKRGESSSLGYIPGTNFSKSFVLADRAKRPSAHFTSSLPNT